jgi:hypothetical protein
VTGVEDAGQVFQILLAGVGRVLGGEHQPGALDRADRDQPTRVLVQPGEPICVRHVAQGPLQAVDPAVEGADERRRAARTLSDGGAPVTAGVTEHPHDPIAGPGGDQWHARHGSGQVGPRVGQCRRRAQRGEPASKHLVHLGVQPLRREVVLDGLEPHLLREVGGARVHVPEDPVGQFRVSEEDHDVMLHSRSVTNNSCNET